MPRPRRRPSAAPFVAMLLLSVAAHMALWPAGDRLLAWNWGEMPLPNAPGMIEVALLTSPDEDEPPEDEKKEQEQRERERDPRGQLVQLDRVLKEARPDDAKYVSEFDSVVDRETRAPTGRKSAAPVARGDRPDADGAQLQGKQSNPDPSNPSTREADESGPGNEAPDRAAQAADLRAGAAASKDGGGVVGRRGLPQAMAATFGAPGSFDSLPNVDQGSETLLNSRRWVYASFFNRMRDAIAQHWEPQTIHHAKDPDARVFGRSPRVTQLAIRLNPDGSLSRIVTARASGAQHLDEEAIRAVRLAAPFINPPPQLVDDDTGYIDVDFTFILDFDRGARLFRRR